MEVFLSYFKRQLGRVAFGLIVIGIFFLTLYLYGVPLEPALYAAVLAIAFGVVCYGYGFVRLPGGTDGFCPQESSWQCSYRSFRSQETSLKKTIRR